uniref:Putative secreted protein n=1 Tax=Panstrongylus lignarius TaxID=156445 RepID=A0A224XSF3_9HEMI
MLRHAYNLLVPFFHIVLSIVHVSLSCDRSECCIYCTSTKLFSPFLFNILSNKSLSSAVLSDDSFYDIPNCSLHTSRQLTALTL